MNILLIFPGFILAFIIVLYYEYKIRRTKPRNKVHFYVARDEYNNTLYLYLSKPYRSIDRFISSPKGHIIEIEDFFYKKGLNLADFSDLKWEDEPVEVFLNLED